MLRERSVCGESVSVLCLFVCPTLPPGGVTLYLVVCVLCMLASALACVASVSDGETPMRFMKGCLQRDPSDPRDDYLTAKAGARGTSATVAIERLAPRP